MSSWYMFRDRYTRNRHGVLFFGLLLSHVLSPVLGSLGFETGVVEALLAMNLVAATLALDRSPVRRAVPTCWPGCSAACCTGQWSRWHRAL